MIMSFPSSRQINFVSSIPIRFLSTGFTKTKFIKKNIPAVFIDADGVLKYGNEPIPKAKEAIDLLR